MGDCFHAYSLYRYLGDDSKAETINPLAALGGKTVPPFQLFKGHYSISIYPTGHLMGHWSGSILLIGGKTLTWYLLPCLLVVKERNTALSPSGHGEKHCPAS